jgi:ribosomal protein S18 acetylase RimI-like enzyme
MSRFEVGKAAPDRLPALAALCWVDSHSPDEPMWQLDSIAVEPAFQGRGVGRALIAAGLARARARADSVGAFLSTGTPRNASI